MGVRLASPQNLGIRDCRLGQSKALPPFYKDCRKSLKEWSNIPSLVNSRFELRSVFLA
jgi:hypothetical protein